MFFCSLDGKHLWNIFFKPFSPSLEILYNIHPFCIYIIYQCSLFIQISPFFHTRFIQCWQISTAGRKSNHMFSVPQMSKGFAKIFFVPLSSTVRYSMIFIHPTIYFCTNSCISVDFTPCRVYLVDFQGRKEDHCSNVIEYSSIHSTPYFFKLIVQ